MPHYCYYSNPHSMSTYPSNMDASGVVDNEYAVILNKRIRAYKKKLERINALKGKQVLSSSLSQRIGSG